MTLPLSQMVRFFYKVDTRSKAKVMRKVSLGVWM